MRLAISNIAWDVSEDEAVASLLTQHGIDAIDVAPGKYFPDPLGAREADIAKCKAWWSSRGIGITGMQALLFGTTGLNVFGSAEAQQALHRHLEAVCRIGAGLGASRLVFGSPKNRDRSGLSDAEALSRAVSFFRPLGDIAQKYGVSICLEPNPPCYGANFMTTSVETAQVVASIDHPAIKMQFDSGANAINGERVETILASSAHLIGHIHASEPQLIPLGDAGTDHPHIHEVLLKFLPDYVVTIEMVATQNEAHLVSIERALLAAMAAYQPERTNNPPAPLSKHAWTSPSPSQGAHS